MERHDISYSPTAPVTRSSSLINVIFAAILDPADIRVVGFETGTVNPRAFRRATRLASKGVARRAGRPGRADLAGDQAEDPASNSLPTLLSLHPGRG